MQERYLHRREANDYFKVVIGYFGLALVVASGALFVDQDNKDKYEPIILPDGATEIEQVNPHTRRFAVESAQKDQIVCGKLNVGYRGTTYTHFMPVERVADRVKGNTILIARDSQNTQSTVDMLVECTYPESDPEFIQKIPIEYRAVATEEGSN